MIRRRLPLLLLLAFAGPLLADGWAEEPREPAHVTRLVEDLEALAAWCHKGRLFAARNEAYEVLLAFRPDHATARKRLKYRRGQDGVWTRSPSYKPPRNLKRPGEELATRRRALADRFAEASLAALQGPAARPGSAARAKALRTILRVAPQRADIREQLGEIQTAEGTWILRESLKTPTRREALALAARRAVRDAPRAEVVRPNREENATRIAWKAIVETERARVAGTVDLAEVRQAHALVEASFAFFAELYGVEAPTLANLSLLLITTDEERATLLANHPRTTASFQSFGASLSSGWFPGTNIVFARSGWKERRLEWSARQPLGALLRRAFRVRTKHGWAFEGFGLYASHLLTGQRQTFYVRRTKYGEKADPADDLWNRLTADGADWRAEARTLLAGPNAPDLRLLLGKPVNTMNTEDMLLSYVLAAWLLEARPQAVVPILHAVAKGTRADALVETHLGMDVEGLALRVRRWLEETKDP